MRHSDEGFSAHNFHIPGFEHHKMTYMILSDPVALIGLVFLGIILIVIVFSLGSKIFEDEPLFVLAAILAELSLAVLVLVNPWMLMLIGLLFGVVVIFSIFVSSVFLGIETLVLGVPSLVLFAYSLFDQQNRLWLNILSVSLFFAGLVVSQLELGKPLSEILGTLFPVFVFSLAIVGVFLIPTIFPQFELITQVAELAGTITGVLFSVRAYASG